MPEVERLEIESQVENLSKIEAWVDSFCESHFPAAEFRQKMHLVVEELFMNAVMHGYGAGGGVGPVWLALHPLQEGAALVMEDESPPFNVLEDGPAPDTQSDVEDRPVGGLGIMLVRNMCDRVSYDYDKRNRITAVFGSGRPPDGGARADGPGGRESSPSGSGKPRQPRDATR